MKYCEDSDGKVYQLQRCPFCGMDVAEIMSQTDYIDELGCDPYEHAETYTVVCSFLDNGCGATCGYHYSVSEAVRRWNTRVVI